MKYLRKFNENLDDNWIEEEEDSSFDDNWVEEEEYEDEEDEVTKEPKINWQKLKNFFSFNKTK